MKNRKERLILAGKIVVGISLISTRFLATSYSSCVKQVLVV